MASVSAYTIVAIIRKPAAAASAALDDVYDPDDIDLRDSPLLKSIRPNLQPS